MKAKIEDERFQPVKTAVTTLFSLLFSISVFAQTGSVAGSIRSSGTPLQFATVGIEKSGLGAITDVHGNFELGEVPYGEHELIISMVGYETRSEQIRISASKPAAVLDISLEESIEALDAVMVVSGTMREMSKLESPVPVEVYTPEFFKANPTPSIFESMQNVNGVRPQLNCNVCNTGDIHINGLEGPYTMVTIDGMPIVSGLSTVYGLTGIPQSLIERVEIVKGPASTLYGSEAVGGLINIITRKPVTAPKASVDIFGSSWGEANGDIGFKFGVGEKVNSLVGINYFIYQNPIDNNKDGFTDVTLQDRISIFNKWTIDHSKNRIFSLGARYVYEDRWGGEMNWTPKYRGGDEIYGESIYTRRWETFGIYQFPFEEMINLEFSANGHKQNSVYGNMEYRADQYIGFGQLTWNKEINDQNDLLIGTALRYTYYDDNTPATASFDTVDNPSNKPSVTFLPGIFIQNELRINDQNKLLGGMRLDRNTRHGSIFSPRLNYKWNTLDQRHILRLSIGNGFRVANVFTEDHAALTGAREVEFASSLQPEKSWNANLNAVKKIYTRNSTYIGFDLSVFYTYYNNRILPDYESNPNKIIYDNLDGFSVSRGVSLNTELNWENGFSALVGTTIQDVFIEEDGEREVQILTERISGVWNIGYTIPAIDLTIDYTGNVYGPMRLPILGSLDDRPEYSPWWSTQNIQLTQRFGRLEIYSGIKNLLNFTPPANSIARSFDPFDRDVSFDDNGQVLPTPGNPNALTFDPSYVFAPNQGIRGFFGLRYSIY